MVERLGEMRKGRRERIEKGSREGIEKETKRHFEEKEGLRLEFLYPTLPVAIVSSSPQGMTSWSSSIKISFYKLIERIIQKICHGVKQNEKKSVIGETECNDI